MLMSEGDDKRFPGTTDYGDAHEDFADQLGRRGGVVSHPIYAPPKIRQYRVSRWNGEHFARLILPTLIGSSDGGAETITTRREIAGFALMGQVLFAPTAQA
jgi:predicted alpha/beta-hydrolase family hydrolase